jgi:hypothetical protein
MVVRTSGARLLDDLSRGELVRLATRFSAAAARRDKNQLLRIEIQLARTTGGLRTTLAEYFGELLNTAFRRGTGRNVGTQAFGILNAIENGDLLTAADAVSRFAQLVDKPRRRAS